LLDLDWTFGKKGTEYFKECLAKENSCAFVVEDKKQVVGYLCGGISKAESYRNAPKVAELDNMFVLGEYRGKKGMLKLLN